MKARRIASRRIGDTATPTSTRRVVETAFMLALLALAIGLLYVVKRVMEG